MTTTTDGRLIDLIRDDAGRRYRASVAGDFIAETEYLLTPDLLVFTHTVVDPGYEGQGVGSALVRWALDDARSRGYHVVPTCPFVRAYIDRHGDEYADLVYRSRTAPPA
jgi:hypothetical protein